MTEDSLRKILSEVLSEHPHHCQVFPTEEDRVVVKDVVERAKDIKENFWRYTFKFVGIVLATAGTLVAAIWEIFRKS